jgi:hypothetical protein
MTSTSYKKLIFLVFTAFLALSYSTETLATAESNKKTAEFFNKLGNDINDKIIKPIQKTIIEPVYHAVVTPIIDKIILPIAQKTLPPETVELIKFFREPLDLAGINSKVINKIDDEAKKFNARLNDAETQARFNVLRQNGLFFVNTIKGLLNGRCGPKGMINDAKYFFEKEVIPDIKDGFTIFATGIQAGEQVLKGLPDLLSVGETLVKIGAQAAQAQLDIKKGGRDLKNLVTIGYHLYSAIKEIKAIPAAIQSAVTLITDAGPFFGEVGACITAMGEAVSGGITSIGEAIGGLASCPETAGIGCLAGFGTSIGQGVVAGVSDIIGDASCGAVVKGIIDGAKAIYNIATVIKNLSTFITLAKDIKHTIEIALKELEEAGAAGPLAGELKGKLEKVNSNIQEVNVKLQSILKQIERLGGHLILQTETNLNETFICVAEVEYVALIIGKGIKDFFEQTAKAVDHVLGLTRAKQKIDEIMKTAAIASQSKVKGLIDGINRDGAEIKAHPERFIQNINLIRDIVNRVVALPAVAIASGAQASFDQATKIVDESKQNQAAADAAIAEANKTIEDTKKILKPVAIKVTIPIPPAFKEALAEMNQPPKDIPLVATPVAAPAVVAVKPPVPPVVAVKPPVPPTVAVKPLVPPVVAVKPPVPPVVAVKPPVPPVVAVKPPVPPVVAVKPAVPPVIAVKPPVQAN